MPIPISLEEFEQLERTVSHILQLLLFQRLVLVQLELELLDIDEFFLFQQFLAYFLLDHREPGLLLQQESILHLDQDERKFFFVCEGGKGLDLLVPHEFPCRIHVAIIEFLGESQLVVGTCVFDFELDLAFGLLQDGLEALVLEAAEGECEGQFECTLDHVAHSLLQLSTLLHEGVQLLGNELVGLRLEA